MYVQGVENVYDLNFNGLDGEARISYGDVFLQAEQEYSRYNFEHADTALLFQHFKDAEGEARAADPDSNDRRHRMALPAYPTQGVGRGAPAPELHGGTCLPAYDHGRLAAPAHQG